MRVVLRRALALLLLVLLSVPMVAADEATEIEVSIPGVEFTGPCALLTRETPRSDACDAEIAANPLPELEQPITYEPSRDGQAHSRAVFLPETSLPYPIGWQKRNWYFMDGPGILPEPDDWTNKRLVDHYEMFYIYNAVFEDNAWWYLIDAGKWMKEDYVSVLQIPQRPEEVSGRWVSIDLQQQVLLVQEDDQPVLATLISSGYWLDTTEGLFQIYARTLSMRMIGPPGVKPPVYDFVTKWAMFFNEHQAVHSASFHNHFGLKRSHGCVNMVPGDIEWLWNYLGENSDEWDPIADSFRVDNPEKAPWVLVFNSDRDIVVQSW